jgi:hypothetical protein
MSWVPSFIAVVTLAWLRFTFVPIRAAHSVFNDLACSRFRFAQ